MAAAVEQLPLAQRHPIDRRPPAVVLRSVAALAAVTGLGLALFFGVGPIRVTVHDRVAVAQLSGEQGTGLTVTDQTQPEVRRVTCVPFLRWDGGANEDAACAAHVRGPLHVAGVGLLVFLAGSALWILSGGDRALGLSGLRPLIVDRQS